MRKKSESEIRIQKKSAFPKDRKKEARRHSGPIENAKANGLKTKKQQQQQQQIQS